MLDVVSIGEVLIDFGPSGVGKMNNPCFEMNPGGAPANVLVMNSRLGGKTGFIGMVGEDYFGHFLKDVLVKENVDVRGLKMTQRACTTLVFVSLDEHGEREFSFVRKPGADYMIEKKDIDYNVIDDAKMVHFGMATLTNSPGRETLFAALDYAKNKGKLISYDPNFRIHSWPDLEEAKRMALMGLEYADVVKMSETELEMFLGYSIQEVDKGAKYILDMGKKAVFITLGGQGSYYAAQDGCGHVKGYPVQVMDTTGCGDAFMGTMHYMMANRPDLPTGQAMKYANAAGAVCATRMGGIPAMPTMEEIEKMLG